MFLNWMVEQFDYCSQVLTETGYFDAIEGYAKQISNICRSNGVETPRKALCLGLGQLEKSQLVNNHIHSFMQYPVFERMLESLNIPHSSAALHDPAFSALDKHFLKLEGFNLPSDHDEATRQLVCHAPTLVFCPFVPYFVFEHLLAANWNPERLSNVVLIGTKIHGWLDDDEWFRKMREASIPRTRRCMPLFEVMRLPSLRARFIAKYGNAHGPFQDDSCTFAHSLEELQRMWIPPARVAAMGDMFWKISKKYQPEREVWPSSRKGSGVKSKL